MAILFAHRAFHALPKSIRRTGDRGGGAIVGFANILLRLYESERPRAVLVGWDTLGAPTYRQRLFPDYQSGRHFDDELVDQLNVLPQFIAACGFANAKASGYEADDFLAAATAEEELRHGTVLVASGDRDAFQLASATTTILHPVKGGEMARIGPDEVRERYGIEPHQVPDFIALRGDPSDKLPGARGIGTEGRRSSAASIRHARARCLAEGRLSAQATELKLYKKIATMDAMAPLPALHDQTPTWNTAAELAREWELDRLARRLEEITATASGSAVASSTVKAARRRQTSQQLLKIATFNINNVNRRLANLLGWLNGSQPNVVLPPGARSRLTMRSPQPQSSEVGYRAIWRGQRTYNGVAILTNIGEPQQTRDRLPGDPADDQSRYIEAAVKGVLVASIYLPNGNPQPGPKFDYDLVDPVEHVVGQRRRRRRRAGTRAAPSCAGR